MEQLPTPYNNFFQFALAHSPNARSLIETQLSPAALAELNLDTLQLETGSFIDADLRGKFSDLLMSVRLAGSDAESEDDRALVYFLFEHKSQSLRLLKYSRSDHLASILGEIRQLIAQALPESCLPQWIQAIGVYIMSVNKDIDSQQYKQTLKSVFPTQFEPGSRADRLLIQGREEGREQGLEQGKLAGRIQTLQELLGDAVSTDDELLSRDREALMSEIAGLQARLRHRDT